MNTRIYAAFLLLTAAGCQKKDDTAPDAGKVSISIASPQAGQTFHAGDTVFIRATVRYPGELHGYEVKITDAAGQVLHDLAQHVHDDHFEIDDRWVPSGTSATALKLSLTTSIDHDGDDARKEVAFNLMP